MHKRWIEVKGEYEGFHKYENAPDEVAFLRNSHRHIFKWNAQIEVFHDDRELEYFIVLKALQSKVLPFISMSGNWGSCEMQADKILEGIRNLYGSHRDISVCVTEDGENGSISWWTPDSY